MTLAPIIRRTLVALGVLMLVTGAPAQDEDLERVEPNTPSIPDAVRLYSLDQVTVVYPTGPGENVDENRRSARFRAEYLKRRYGVDAREAADDALTEAEKKGNLLVLGWGNRVLAGLKPPHPFEKRERGFVFAGIVEPAPSADLLFVTYSPLEPRKLLCFWSRIDPELDRFQPLPFVGSNWAIQRDFLVIRQGMFVPESPWPPVRNENGEANHGERLLEIESQRKVRRTPHFDVYYLPSAAIERDLDAIVSAREAAFGKAVSLLGAPPEDFRIRLFLYDSAEDKKDRCGVADAAHSVPRSRELHMIQRMAQNPSAHEEIHLVARQTIGPAYLTSMYEGLAVAEDGIFSGAELDVLAAIQVDQTGVPALDDLLSEARMRSMDERVAFPASGQLVRFLRETTGNDGLKRAFVLPTDAGVEGLAAALGKDAGSLATAWDRWYRQRAAARKADLEFFKQQNKAQERYAASDYAGVAAALEKALRAKPDDPQTLFNLAAARIRTGDYGKAEKSLRRILDLTLSRKDAHLNPFSHYQLGRIYDVQGRRKDAEAEYRVVLGLPDVNESHRLAREALETPVTKDQLE